MGKRKAPAGASASKGAPSASSSTELLSLGGDYFSVHVNSPSCRRTMPLPGSGRGGWAAADALPSVLPGWKGLAMEQIRAMRVSVHGECLPLRFPSGLRPLPTDFACHRASVVPIEYAVFCPHTHSRHTSHDTTREYLFVF